MRTSLIHASDFHLTWGKTCDGRLPQASSDVHTQIVAEALVEHLSRRLHRGDRNWHLVITGDLIDTGSTDELALARDILAPIWDPDLLTVVPGNHDCAPTTIAAYGKMAGLRVPASVAARRRAFARTFGELMMSSAPFRGYQWPFVKVLRNRALVLVGLDSTADNTFQAGGIVGDQQLKALDEILARCELDRRLEDFGVWVALHHPPAEMWHTHTPFGLADHEELLEICEGRVTAIIHGHAHQTEADWDGTDEDLPVLQAAPPSYDEDDPSPTGEDSLTFPCYTVRNGDLRSLDDIGEIEISVEPALRQRHAIFRAEYASGLRKPVACDACDGPVTTEMSFCPWCGDGTDFTGHSELVCNECCQPVMPGFEVCPWCGEEFEEADGRYGTGGRMSEECSKCDSGVEPYHRYCACCGAVQDPPDDDHPVSCNRCNWPVDPSTYLFCPWCGERQ